MSEARATDELTACPGSIAVIGGGRWARTIVQVLCRLVPASAVLSVHSRHNSESMRAWVAGQGLAGKVQVAAEWPGAGARKPGAVIVANAARDHEPAAVSTLSAGIPTLIEKPFATSADAARRIADLARRNGARLAAAHVFLFARYVERFAQLVAEAGAPSALRMRWEDPAIEHRHGELKSYDASLPVPADVLPHLVSILGVLAPGVAVDCGAVAVRRGGAQVGIDLAVGGIPCAVQLIRNGEKRRRSVEAVTGQGAMSLDFANEPGTIVQAGRSIAGDPEWGSAKRPLARMLTAFLRWAAGGDGDDRLDLALGIEACRIVDQALEKYRPAQASWLNARRASGDQAPDDDVAYALAELNVPR